MENLFKSSSNQRIIFDLDRYCFTDLLVSRLQPDFMHHQPSLVDINKTLIFISLYESELIHAFLFLCNIENIYEKQWLTILKKIIRNFDQCWRLNRCNFLLNWRKNHCDSMCVIKICAARTNLNP